VPSNRKPALSLRTEAADRFAARLRIPRSALREGGRAVEWARKKA
jgi:hypothetical protein